MAARRGPDLGTHAVAESLERIQALDSRLNSFLTVTADAALAAAPAGAATSGPLAGVPVGIKDLIATAGVRTTAGSRILAEWVPQRDAHCVSALRRAGAVVVGKTGTHEFAFGTTNDNPHYGAVHNPWDTALTSGGSSGGSAAAVAAGLVPLALGTDTAGSVRIPAALCGCVGFKPGWGEVPTRGVVPLAPTLDTVGYLACDVATAARAHAAVTGGGVPGPASLAGRTVGVFEEHAFGASEAGVVRVIEEALRVLEAQGARIRRMSLRALADVVDIGVPLVRAEAARFHARWFPARRSEYGPDVANSLAAGLAVTGVEYLGARRRRRHLERALLRLLEDIDLVAGPTVPIVAFANAVAWDPVLPGGELPRFALTRLTYPFSLGRLPAISIPAGLAGGLPVGLQVAGRVSAAVLAAAAGYEAARGPLPVPAVHV